MDVSANGQPSSSAIMALLVYCHRACNRGPFHLSLHRRNANLRTSSSNALGAFLVEVMST